MTQTHRATPSSSARRPPKPVHRASVMGQKIVSFVGRRPLTILTLVVLVYLVVVPLVTLGVSSLRPTGFVFDSGWTFENYIKVYTSPRTYRMLLDTVIFAAGGTAVALVFGATFAWLVERTNIPGARLFRTIVILPMAMPPLLLALAWILLLSPSIGLLNTVVEGIFGANAHVFDIYTLPGMIFVEGLSLTPTAFLLTVPTLRNMDPSLEDAASASGANQWRILTRITIPMMKPTLLAAAIFLFIIGLLVFDVPGLIGIRGGIFTLSSEIYYQLSGGAGAPNYGYIGAMAVLPILALFPLTILYQRMLRKGHRYVTVTSRSFRPRKIQLGRWRYVAMIPLIVYLLAGVVLPLLMLLVTSFLPYYTKIDASTLSQLTFANYVEIFEDRHVQRAVINTAVIGFTVATALAIFAPVISRQVIRTRGLAAQVIDKLAFLPVAFSHTMIGVALVFVYLSLNAIPIYGTIWIIIIAHITGYLTFATRTINGALLQIDPDLEAAARVSGASGPMAMRRITYPLLRPAILVVWIWVIAHSMRELSAALILTGRDNPVVSTVLWSFWEGGNTTVAAALGVCLMIVLGILSFAWDRFENKKVRK